MQSIKFKPFIEIPYHRNSHKMQQHQSITENKKNKFMRSSKMHINYYNIHITYVIGKRNYIIIVIRKFQSVISMNIPSSFASWPIDGKGNGCSKQHQLLVVQQ